MKRILFLLLAALVVSCSSYQKTSTEEMEAYKKELQEKIKVAKVTIVQMKLDLEELGDSLTTAYNSKIADFEDRLNKAEKEYDTFKDITEKEIWTTNKAKMDSIFGYLELQIDSTRTNIKQIIKQ
jgi:Vesicle transport v-SNARE protein N-terminus